ncbi:hypothetical protein SCHPADRAFT_946036 [Schizopora paradoxa]|uniref:Uncharacterized protein n=1 Tax=Schizopora paradoxa TaxID=27342 RepID=A0A0H2R3Z8_9AGAM|nr:hypothetical protein SCHPADRAFT_946036 [Schizopora paradoxa]
MESTAVHIPEDLETGKKQAKKKSFKFENSITYGLPLIIFSIFLIFFLACFSGPDPFLFTFRVSISKAQYYNFGVWGYSDASGKYSDDVSGSDVASASTLVLPSLVVHAIMTTITFIVFVAAFFATLHQEAGINWVYSPRGSQKRKKKLMLWAVLVVMILGTLSWVLDVIRVIYVSRKVTGSTIPGLMFYLVLIAVCISIGLFLWMLKMEKKKTNPSHKAVSNDQSAPQGPMPGPESGFQQDSNANKSHDQELSQDNESESQHTPDPNHQDSGTAGTYSEQSDPHNYDNQNLRQNQTFEPEWVDEHNQTPLHDDPNRDFDWDGIKNQQYPLGDPHNQVQGDQFVQEVYPQGNHNKRFSEVGPGGPRRQLSTLDELSEYEEEEEEEDYDPYYNYFAPPTAPHDSLGGHPFQGQNKLESQIDNERENDANVLQSQTTPKNTELPLNSRGSTNNFEELHDPQAYAPTQQIPNPQQNESGPSNQVIPQNGEKINTYPLDPKQPFMFNTAPDLHTFNVNTDDAFWRQLKLYIDEETDKKLAERLGKNPKKMKYLKNKQETGETSEDVPVPPYTPSSSSQGKTNVKDSVKSGLRSLKDKFTHKSASPEHEGNRNPRVPDQGQYPQLPPNQQDVVQTSSQPQVALQNGAAPLINGTPPNMHQNTIQQRQITYPGNAASNSNTSSTVNQETPESHSYTYSNNSDPHHNGNYEQGQLYAEDYESNDNVYYESDDNDFVDPQTGEHSNRFALLDENGNVMHDNSPSEQYQGVPLTQEEFDDLYEKAREEDYQRVQENESRHYVHPQTGEISERFHLVNNDESQALTLQRQQQPHAPQHPPSSTQAPHNMVQQQTQRSITYPTNDPAHPTNQSSTTVPSQPVHRSLQQHGPGQVSDQVPPFNNSHQFQSVRINPHALNYMSQVQQTRPTQLTHGPLVALNSTNGALVNQSQVHTTPSQQPSQSNVPHQIQSVQINPHALNNVSQLRQMPPTQITHGPLVPYSSTNGALVNTQHATQ